MAVAHENALQFIVDEMNWIQHVSVNALDTGRNADEILRTLQALKAGGLIGGANDLETDLLSRFGENIGLAFQIVDDVLDCESSEVELGKPVNIDNNLGKTTFVSVLGVEKSKEKVSKLINEAKMELNEFGNKAEKLLKLADFVETRKN